MNRMDMWQLTTKTLTGTLDVVRLAATRDALERYLTDAGASRVTFTPLADAPAVYTVHVYGSDNAMALEFTAGITRDMRDWQQKTLVMA